LRANVESSLAAAESAGKLTASDAQRGVQASACALLPAEETGTFRRQNNYHLKGLLPLFGCDLQTDRLTQCAATSFFLRSGYSARAVAKHSGRTYLKTSHVAIRIVAAKQ